MKIAVTWCWFEFVSKLYLKIWTWLMRRRCVQSCIYIYTHNLQIYSQNLSTTILNQSAKTPWTVFITTWSVGSKGYCRWLHLSVRLSVRRNLNLVRTITRFERCRPNSQQMGLDIMGYSQSVLKTGVIDFDLQGHFGHFTQNFRKWWFVSDLGWNNQICTEHAHYNDVMISAMASQITSLTIVYSTVYSGTDERKHQSSASLACDRWIPRTKDQ